MPDPITPAANPNPAEAAPAPAAEETSLLENAGKAEAKAEGSLLDQAAANAKAAKEAEEKKLLETPDEQLTPEQKTAKEALVKAKAEAKTKADAEAKAKEVPEKYEFKLPEGYTVDQVQLDKVTPVFKELGLNQAAAQKLVDVYIEQQKLKAETDAKAFSDFLETSKQETIKALGAKYQEELAFAAKARDALFSPETLELFNAAGLGNQKNLIMDLIKIGRMISEDKLFEGVRPAPAAGRKAEDILYDKK